MRLLPASLIALFLLGAATAYLVAGSKGEHYDVAFVNVVIHEGIKGSKGYVGGLGIREDRIVRIWKGRPWIFRPTADHLIDGGGRDLAPGFIDTHSHADLSFSADGLEAIRADNFVGQGVTTVIAGNCGRSHSDIATLARNLGRRGSNVNFATLIGLGSVRRKIMGDSGAPPSSPEMAGMREMVRAGMNAGALGVSTGLAYPPGLFASKPEIIELLKVARDAGGIHATHLRSEGGEIAKAVEEALDCSQAAGIPLMISHYKIIGLNNSGKFETLEDLIARSRAKGNRVYVDFYPYDASSTNLNIFLPSWYLEKSRREKMEALADPLARERLKNEIRDLLLKDGFRDLHFATVSYYPPRRDWQGRSLGEITRMERHPTEAGQDRQIDLFLELEKNGGAQMIYRNICADVMDRIPKEEENCIGSDSAIRSEEVDSLPHPRGWGAFPRFIRRYVNEKGDLSLDEAIYRMSGLPARIFKLDRRGTILKGSYADLVLFDHRMIRDRATYREPFSPPSGIHCVIVNGKVVIDNLGELRGGKNVTPKSAKISDRFPGRFLNRGT